MIKITGSLYTCSSQEAEQIYSDFASVLDLSTNQECVCQNVFNVPDFEEAIQNSNIIRLKQVASMLNMIDKPMLVCCENGISKVSIACALWLTFFCNCTPMKSVKEIKSLIPKAFLTIEDMNSFIDMVNRGGANAVQDHP